MKGGLAEQVTRVVFEFYFPFQYLIQCILDRVIKILIYLDFISLSKTLYEVQI